MLHPSISDDAYYFSDSKDDGKSVLVSSSSGCFSKEPGVVLVGPYVFPYVYEELIKNKSKNPMAAKRYKKENRISAPMWVIEITSTGRSFSFSQSEFEFGSKKINQKK
jgi:hypothetical protein